MRISPSTAISPWIAQVLSLISRTSPSMNALSSTRFSRNCS